MAGDVEKLIAEIIFKAQTGEIDKVSQKLKQLEKETTNSDKKLSASQQKQVRELKEFVKTEQQAADRVKQLNAELTTQQKLGNNDNVKRLSRELDVAKKYQANLEQINKTRLEAIAPKKQQPIKRAIAPEIDKRQLSRDIDELSGDAKELEEVLDLDRVLFPKGFGTRPGEIDSFVGDLKSIQSAMEDLEARFKQAEFDVRFGDVSDLPDETSETTIGQYGKSLSMDEYEKRYGAQQYEPHSAYDDKVTPEDWERPKWTRESVAKALNEEQRKLYEMEEFFKLGKQKKSRVDAKKKWVKYLQAVQADFDEPGTLDKFIKSNIAADKVHVDPTVKESPEYKQQQKRRVLMSKVKSAEARDYKKQKNLNTIWDVARPKVETKAIEAFAMADAQNNSFLMAIRDANADAVNAALDELGEKPFYTGRQKPPSVDAVLKGGDIDKAVEDIDKVIDEVMAEVIMEDIDDAVKKATQNVKRKKRKKPTTSVKKVDDTKSRMEEITEDVGSLDFSQQALDDVKNVADDTAFEYNLEPPVGDQTKATVPERPETEERNRQLMLKDFEALAEEARIQYQKASDNQRRGKGTHYAVQKASYRLSNILETIEKIKSGQDVWIGDEAVSPFAYSSEILKDANFPSEFKQREREQRKERIDRLPEDLQFMASQKKVNISQAEEIASKRMTDHNRQYNEKLQQQRSTPPSGMREIVGAKINDIFGNVKSSIMGALDEQKVTMTGEFDTEQDMEEWINKLSEFGGVTNVGRKEKDVKYQTPEGPFTQRRHVGTVTMTKTNEDLMQQRDALKQVNQSVVDQGKAYSTTHKVASRYTGGLTAGFARVGQKFKTLSWQFTMLSMGSLGVFFSMMSFSTLLRSAFGALLTPIMNLEQAFQSLGMAVGLEDLSAVKLEGENPAEQILGDPESLVTAWATMQYIVGNITAALIAMGVELLSDEEFVANLETAFNLMMEALQSDEMIESIKSLADSFVELLPSLIELIPWVAEFFKILTINLPIIGPLLPFLVKLALAAAVLMPIFSVLSMSAGIVGVVFNALSAIGTYLLIPALELIAAALGVTVGTLAAVVLAILAVIAVIAIILDYFGLLDDAVNGIISTFQFFLDVLSSVFSMISSIFNKLSDLPIVGGLMGMASKGWQNNANMTKGAGDWLEGLKMQDRDTGETAFASDRGVRKTDVTVNQNIYGTANARETADLANAGLVDAVNTSIH